MAVRYAAARSARGARFARASRGLQRLHQIRRLRNIDDGARLVCRQAREVRGTHVQSRAGDGRVDEGEDTLFLGDDRVDGEHLVPLAVVRFPRCADAHRNCVDDLLDHAVRIPGRVHR